jgi:glycosyltransferase involved in cell wall biosynthesis
MAAFSRTHKRADMNGARRSGVQSPSPICIRSAPIMDIECIAPYHLGLLGDIASSVRMPRPTLLFVVHSWGGGAIRYARELAEYIVDRANVVFAWGVDNRSFHISTCDPETPESSFDLARGLAAPVRAIRALDIRRADLLCTVGLEAYIDELLDRLAVPFDVTHLGYELIAHNQMRRDGRYIGDAALSAKAAAVRRSGGLPRYLGKAERRIACSRDAAWRASRLMPGIPVLPARFPERSDPHKVVPRLEPHHAGEPLRVLALGRLAPHKGLAAICEVARIADTRNFPIEITCLGELQVARDDIPTFGQHLRILGSYAQDELEAIVRRLQPHLAWLPFALPETHSFALSDVMRLGLPVLATGHGAIPERVERRPATWLVPVEEANPEGFFRWFERLYSDGLSTPPHWMSTSHLPPLVPHFYERDYLAAIRDRQSAKGAFGARTRSLVRQLIPRRQRLVGEGVRRANEAPWPDQD